MSESLAPARALPPTKSRVERRRTLLLLLTFALQPTPVRSRMPMRSRFGRLVACVPRERQWPAGPAVVLQDDARHLHLETLVGTQQPQLLAMRHHPGSNGLTLPDDVRPVVDDQCQAASNNLDVLLDLQPHPP